MCKTICDLKDAFIFIPLSCNFFKKPNGEKKKKKHFLVTLLCAMAFMQHAYLKVFLNN
jgi:hypothetical protein